MLWIPHQLGKICMLIQFLVIRNPIHANWMYCICILVCFNSLKMPFPWILWKFFQNCSNLIQILVFAIFSFSRNSWSCWRFQCNIRMFFGSASNFVELLDKRRWSNDSWLEKISVSKFCHSSYHPKLHRKCNIFVFCFELKFAWFEWIEIVWKKKKMNFEFGCCEHIPAEFVFYRISTMKCICGQAWNPKIYFVSLRNQWKCRGKKNQCSIERQGTV